MAAYTKREFHRPPTKSNGGLVTTQSLSYRPALTGQACHRLSH